MIIENRKRYGNILKLSYDKTYDTICIFIYKIVWFYLLHMYKLHDCKYLYKQNTYMYIFVNSIFF